MDTQAPLLKVADVARRLGVSRPTVYRLIDNGELPSVRFSVSPDPILRVPSDLLDRWIRDRVQGGAVGGLSGPALPATAAGAARQA